MGIFLNKSWNDILQNERQEKNFSCAIRFYFALDNASMKRVYCTSIWNDIQLRKGYIVSIMLTK